MRLTARSLAGAEDFGESFIEQDGVLNGGRRPESWRRARRAAMFCLREGQQAEA